MDNLVLHRVTRAKLEQFIEHPSHALLLTGPRGVGKTAVAEALIAGLLNLASDKLASHPYYCSIKPERDSISINAIRQLRQFVQLKTVGDRTLRRAILVEHAQAMTDEAQNAILKLLEEPPADTLLVLTAKSPRALLPTVLSRLQTIDVLAVPDELLQPLLLDDSESKEEQRRTLLLSAGLPGLLTALLRKEDSETLGQSILQAKELLKSHQFERLAGVDELSKQKSVAHGVSEALERIAKAGLAAADDAARAKRWHHVRKAAAEAQKVLEANGNAKLALTKLFLNL